MKKGLTNFKKTIWSHYYSHKRDMPWRVDTSLYSIVVSEIMLQQTQVARVITKFNSWMKRFPDWAVLAKATNKEVLEEWTGLGYNRRGLYLKRIAEILTTTSNHDTIKLIDLPGIGPNTAGAILAYAFNIPRPFIETNIRSVYIHFFFPKKDKVSDTDILPYIEESLTDPKISKNPREWYWALMDYGSHLKSITPNPSRRSAHHMKQKPFKGSNRELRSKILQSILRKTKMPAGYPAADIRRNLAALTTEGFIVKKGRVYEIA